MKVVRPLSVPLLAIAVLVATASPAFAAGTVAAAAKPWHYWIAWVLAASAVLIVLVALPVGYLMRVWLPKHRGR